MTARKDVKCVVWDLDNTLWSGTLLENDEVRIDPVAVEVIRTLDRRGILNSVASRSDPGTVMAKLRELGLSDYFLYPQVGWSSKDGSVRRIAEELGIGLDTMAFIDDEPFERDEVGTALPDVRCYDTAHLGALLDRPEFNPAFITDESTRRRLMYRAEGKRRLAQEEFVGPKEDFLAGLGMIFTITQAGEDDLERAEELTDRTNQLNTTGVTYSYAELAHFTRSDDHLLLVASLEDRYGDYGKIGLALVELGSAATLKLLLMSCRVMSRGVGTVLLNYVMRVAEGRGLRLLAEHVPNDRNRMMLITLRLGGFEEVERRGDLLILENRAGVVPPAPDYLDLRADAIAPPASPSPSAS